MKFPKLDRLAVACLLLVWLAPLQGENLVSVQHEVLVAPPEAVNCSTLAATDAPLILRDGEVWRYDAVAALWNKVSPRMDGSIIRGVLTSGPNAWFILGQPSGQYLERLVAFAVADGPRVGQPPPFPVPLRVAHGAVQDGVLYLAGVDAGGSPHWWSLSLSVPRSQWTILPVWSDRSDEVATVTSQDLSLVVTTSTPKGGGDQLWIWTAAGGWQLKRTLPGKVVSGAARPLGQAHILYLVQMPLDASGLPRTQLFTYHTTTASLAPQGLARTGNARFGAGWRNGIVWLDSQGTVHSAEIKGSKQLLRPLDWVMIVLYFAMIAGIGYYCYRQEGKRTTAEFFVGNRSIPFWAAGISLYASNSSSIGYIATTAKAYATDWTYLMGNITNVLALVFVAIWIVPLLRRLSLTSVFHYLDQRFHRSVRLAGSGMCIIMHLGGRMSVILFLPALAISTVTGLAVEWSILMMGVVTIVYTALGGMKAVIWTDVAQVTVKFGGLLFAICYIVWRLKGGASEFVATAVADDKLKLLDWSFDLTKATIWGFLFLQLMETVLTFPKDQVLMQRVFATKSEKEAGRSIWIFAAIVLPGSLVLYLIGTGLYVFYHSFPERMNPLLRTDATLPLFIAAELPVGVTGLVLAGLFAAAMGTLSSILNSVATLVSVDFYESLAKKPSQVTSIRIAEWVTVVAGAIGICFSLLLSRISINSFLDVAIEFAGLFGGAFGGAYTLGMFTRRSNWQGVLIGMGVSYVTTFVIWWFHLLHPFLYLAAAILISIVVGYVASYLFPPPPPEKINGLTVLTTPAT